MSFASLGCRFGCSKSNYGACVGWLWNVCWIGLAIYSVLAIEQLQVNSEMPDVYSSGTLGEVQIFSSFKDILGPLPKIFLRLY